MPNQVLIVVDVQNDFCPSGALAVSDGDAILKPVNFLVDRFDHVILTQDWHPSGHSSFASSHPGKKPLESVTLAYGEQTLWPDHCVQDSHGARFHEGLQATRAELILRKGFRATIDSYSAFFENDHKTPTGLAGYLRDRGLDDVTLCGLATDYCVGFSALDAVALGFKTTVVLEACRAIDLAGSLQAMMTRMRDAGVKLI